MRVKGIRSVIKPHFALFTRDRHETLALPISRALITPINNLVWYRFVGVIVNGIKRRGE